MCYNGNDGNHRQEYILGENDINLDAHKEVKERTCY